METAAGTTAPDATIGFVHVAEDVGPSDTVTTVSHASHLAGVPGVPNDAFDTIEADVIADLAAVGLVVGEEATMAQAARDAMAGFYLRRHAALEAERDRLRAQMDYELTLVAQHYERQFGPIERKLADYERAIMGLAEVSDFGKKKSAKTPWGEYGYRERSATVELTDPQAALQWAKDYQPGVVRVAVQMPFTQARTVLPPEQLATAKHELAWSEFKKTLAPDEEALPPGVSVVPARTEYFAKAYPHTEASGR